MRINKTKIGLIFFGIILGLLIGMQIGVNIELYIPVTIASLENMADEVEIMKDEIEDLDRIIEEKEKELNLLKEIGESDEDIVDVLADDLRYNRVLSGNTKIQGPGISIKMYDNPDSEVVGFDIDDDIIHDVDILNILNDLKVAGAEAISINDERVMSSSEIKCLGPVVKINKKSVGTPFIIRAVGDPKSLMASVVASGTYGDILKNVYAIGFEPKIEDNIVIEEYRGNFSFKYAEPKEEDGN